MSYILDALRKAESERERGRVPGVHAQPGFGGGVPAGPRDSGRRGGVWIVSLLAAVVLLVGVLGWLLMRPSLPAAVVASNATTAAPATSFPPPATTPAAATATPATPAAVTPAPAMPGPAPVTAPPQAEPPRRARPVPPAAAASAVAPTVSPPKAAARASDSASAPRLLAFGDLPDDIRRQLPALAVGGSVYSSVPANRMVILNGQVLHEGENIAPDLLLQQIKLKAAVLSFRGTRFELSF